MKKWKTLFSEKPVRVLLTCAMILIVLGSIFALAGDTSFGEVTAKRIVLDSDGGATVSGTLYVPKGVTAQNPAPAVYVEHGGSNTRESMVNYAIELSRRGFVVFNVESWGNGDTQANRSGDTHKAGYYAVKWLRTLAYVDNIRIGLMAHSAGAANVCDMATNDNDVLGVKAVLVTGAGARNFTVDTPVNLGYLIGYRDENHATSRKMPYDPEIQAIFGTTETIQLGQWYGDLQNNTGRILWTPGFMFHLLMRFDSRAMDIAVSYFDATLNHTSTLTNHVWYFKTIGCVLAFSGLVCLIFGLLYLCLNSHFFQPSYKVVESRRQVEKTPQYYILMVLVLLIPVFLCQKLFVAGNTVMPKISSRFKLPIINGAIFYSLIFGAISFCLNLVMKKLTKGYDWKEESLTYRAPWKDIAKWFLISVIIFLTASVIGLVMETYIGFHFSIVLPDLFVLKPQRLAYVLTYYLPFLVVQILAQYCQTTSYRTIGGTKKAFYWTVLAMNTIGMMLYVLVIILIKAYDMPIPDVGFFRVIGWTNAFARYNSICIYMSAMNIVCSGITVFCFDKTKKIYLGSFVNAMILCWLACGSGLS